MERLGLAQDACDRWLRDPDEPEQYYLGPRAEEITVLYEETEADKTARSGFRTVRRKAKLHVMLDGIQEEGGIRVTGFETKHADPRRLLTEYSEGLRGEIVLFLQAWALIKEQEEADRLRALAAAQEEQDLAALMESTLAGTLAGDIAEAFNGLLDAGTGQRVAEYAAPRLLSRLIQRFQDTE